MFDQCTREPAVLIKTKHQPLRISTFNTRTLKDNWRLSELIYNARNQDLSIVGIQEHRRVHEEELNFYQNEGYHFITGSAWRNSSQAAVGGVGILLKNSAERAMSSITSLSPRILVAHFNGNPCTTIIVAYAPTNDKKNEADTETFYNDLRRVTTPQLSSSTGVFKCEDKFGSRSISLP